MKNLKYGLTIFLLVVLMFAFSYSFFLRIYELIGNDNKVVHNVDDFQNNNELEEEIILGDSDNCTTTFSYKSSSSSFSGGNCTNTCGGNSCPSPTKDSASSCTYCNVTNANSSGTMGTKITCTKKSSTSCSSCKSGKYLDGSECKNCPAGSYCSGGKAKPIKCHAGTYSKAGAKECTQCNKSNEYSKEGATSCSTCPTNQVANSGHTDCEVKCKSGYYKDGNTCQLCKKGNMCDGSTMSSCDGNALEYQDLEGQNKCKKCIAGQKANRNHTGCEVVPITSISGGSTLYLTNGETGTMSFSANGNVNIYQGIIFGIVTWNVTPKASLAQTGDLDESLNATITGSGGACSPVLKTYTATATTSGGSSKSKTANVYVYDHWISKTGVFRYKEAKPSKARAKYSSGCNFYEGPGFQNGIYVYTTYWNRCCGGSPAPSDVGHCYADAKYLGIATKVKWMDSADKEHPYELSGISDESRCTLLPEATTCKTSQLKAEAINVETSKCEEEKVITLSNEGQECNGNQFYEIKCNKTITTAFDYNNDNNLTDISTFSLLRGQGFGYGINVYTIKQCEGKFNSKTWKTSYNNAMRKLATVPEKDKDEEVQKRRNELLKLIDDIKDIVIKYNDYLPNESEDEGVNLSIPFKVKGKDNLKIYKFDKRVINDGNGTFVYEKINNNPKETDIYNLNLGVSGLKNPTNFKWNNLNNRRVVNFIPKKVLLSKNSGEIVEDSKNAIDGGNRVYIDNVIDPGTYQINIEVNGLGGNNSIVRNSKCSVTVKKSEVLYRPIDLKNPFINDSREKGVNWVNDTFDYTSTINSNTWSTNPLYVFDLSSDDIVELKNSNNDKLVAESYLGTCYLDEKLQDSITKKICNIIKNNKNNS